MDRVIRGDVEKVVEVASSSDRKETVVPLDMEYTAVLGNSTSGKQKSKVSVKSTMYSCCCVGSRDQKILRKRIFASMQAFELT